MIFDIMNTSTSSSLPCAQRLCCYRELSTLKLRRINRANSSSSPAFQMCFCLTNFPAKFILICLIVLPECLCRIGSNTLTQNAIVSIVDGLYVRCLAMPPIFGGNGISKTRQRHTYLIKSPNGFLI